MLTVLWFGSFAAPEAGARHQLYIGLLGWRHLPSSAVIDFQNITSFCYEFVERVRKVSNAFTLSLLSVNFLLWCRMLKVAETAKL